MKAETQPLEAGGAFDPLHFISPILNTAHEQPSPPSRARTAAQLHSSVIRPPMRGEVGLAYASPPQN